MSDPASAHEYVRRFRANLSRCTAISAEDRANVVVKPIGQQDVWLIARGDGSEELVEEDPAASVPFELVRGGRLSLEVRVRETGGSGQRSSTAVEVVKYSLSFSDLPTNDNRIRCLRYDKPEGQHRGDGWEDELGDNPRHPWAHLHLNFAATEAANECRMPTGSVCPIFLLRAFDHWYYLTFVR